MDDIKNKDKNILNDDTLSSFDNLDEKNTPIEIDDDSSLNKIKEDNEEKNEDIIKEDETKSETPMFEDNTAYKEFSSKNYTKDQLNNIARYQSIIVFEFSLLVGTSPNSSEAHSLVDRWKDFITKYFYTCTDNILNGLSDVYVNDLRFKNNLDIYRPNTAEFISNAIKEYLKNK